MKGITSAGWSRQLFGGHHTLVTCQSCVSRAALLLISSKYGFCTVVLGSPLKKYYYYL